MYIFLIQFNLTQPKTDMKTREIDEKILTQLNP